MRGFLVIFVPVPSCYLRNNGKIKQVIPPLHVIPLIYDEDKFGTKLFVAKLGEINILKIIKRTLYRLVSFLSKIKFYSKQTY